MEAEETRTEDLQMFEDMVEGMDTEVRAMPNLDYCCKLRSWVK